MTPLLSRAFQVSKLTKDRLGKMHTIETNHFNKCGLFFTASEISDIGRLEKKPVNENDMAKLESVIAYFGDSCRELTGSESDPEGIGVYLQVLHTFDWKILNETFLGKLDFSAKSTSIKSKLNKNSKSDEEEIEVFLD